MHHSGSAPWTGLFPIAFKKNVFSVNINRYGGKDCYSWVVYNCSPSGSGFTWKDIGVDGNSGLGDDMFLIAVGN